MKTVQIYLQPNNALLTGFCYERDVNLPESDARPAVLVFGGGAYRHITAKERDPIAMAYEKIYPTLFKSKNETIPEDISKHFVYPQYLYDVQAKVLEIYHNVKPDVLYREDDIWQIAKFNTTNVSIKTPIIATKPCSHGCFTLATA